MTIAPTTIPGVVIVNLDEVSDHRGSFTRLFDRNTFDALGLETDFEQDSIARNTQAGTLRGLHYQSEPHAETKLVTCLSGRVLDVVVDLRPGPTYGHSVKIELDAYLPRLVYVPPGCAHGYQTLADDSTLLYKIHGFFVDAAARGIRWDDCDLAIHWPATVSTISDRDRAWPTLRAIDPLARGIFGAASTHDGSRVAGG